MVQSCRKAPVFEGAQSSGRESAAELIHLNKHILEH